MRPSPTKPEAPAVPEKVTIVPKEVTPAIPKAEAGMPEANIQQIANHIAEIKGLLATKGRLPAGMGTKAELSLEVARLEAQKEVAQTETLDQLENAIEGIENELGNRSLPYHGGATSLYPEYTSKQLDEILKVYEGARETFRQKAGTAALKALRRGWSVIPIILAGGKKRPPEAFKWAEYQDRLPTVEEVRSWWQQWPDAGIAVICGPVSRVYVLDVDKKNGGSLEGRVVPDGPRSKTLHDGNHHFFKSDIPLPKRQGILRGMDFIGEGSYAVLPPSWGQYEWLQEPIGGLPNLPQWVMDLVFNGAHHPPKRKNGKKEWTSHPRPLVEDQVRFLPELNAECIRSKLSWVAIMWTELRMLDQQLTKGRGFIPGNEGCNYLFNRGFSERRVLEALQAGRGIFWKFIWRGPCLTIQLHGLQRVCEALGVKIKNTLGYGHPHWQYVPLADFQGDKRLAHFRAAACYEAKDTSNRVSKISRCSIQDRSGVPPRTQVRDADRLGLLLPTKKKNGRRKCGKSTYIPNKHEEGPRFYQEASILRGAACLGPVGRLATVKQAVEGSRLKTPGRVGDAVGSPTVTAFPRPWKYFWTDRQYQQAIRRAQKGILGTLEVDCNPEVEMPGSERRKYRVRHEVSLWREPK